MSNDGNTEYNSLFSSLISDVKSYSGTDPLLPWLRGIKKLKETLPPRLLKEKLPRFLQKCAETFVPDSRYSNDLRYLRVWLQLMDFVDDPKSVLRKMEKNHIGMKKSLFYQAYALYYEKMKRFDAAEKIYHLGVKNLAEPADELQKSYDQFLRRLERHNHKRVQCRKTNIRRTGEKVVKSGNTANRTALSQIFHKNIPIQEANLERAAGELKKPVLSNSRIKEKVEEEYKFVDDVIVSSEDAQHHGLVEPTLGTREAMDAINSMYREPLPTSKNQSKPGNNSKNAFTIFTDEPFEVYVDGEEADDSNDEVNNSVGASSDHAPVFFRPNELSSGDDKEPQPRRLIREDTVVSRFVGSTISDEPEVENVWHHGLVDPTINLKEAMEDINNMFGKPIEFARKSRSKKIEKVPYVKSSCGEFLILADDEADDRKAENEPSGFLILPDDEMDDQHQSSLPCSSTGKGSDLFEQTMCTKEAMAEIHKLFSMPMDF